MLQHHARVVKDQLDLQEKLDKLEAFFGTALFKSRPEVEQKLLREQSIHMNNYNKVLKERIKAF